MPRRRAGASSRVGSRAAVTHAIRRWGPLREGDRRRERGQPVVHTPTASTRLTGSRSAISDRAGRSVPAVADPERPGVLGRAVAVADIAAERLELEGAVGGVGVGPQVVAAPVDQQLAEAEGGRAGVVGGRVAARLLHDDEVLGVRGPRQVALAAPAGLAGLALLALLEGHPQHPGLALQPPDLVVQGVLGLDPQVAELGRLLDPPA